LVLDKYTVAGILHHSQWPVASVDRSIFNSHPELGVLFEPSNHETQELYTASVIMIIQEGTFHMKTSQSSGTWTLDIAMDFAGREYVMRFMCNALK